MAVTGNLVKRKALRAEIDAGEAPRIIDEATEFELIFRQHWHRVCGVINGLVGDPDEAQDLALEVFWRLYRQPPVLGPQQNLTGWLYRVATNLGYNALRARLRRRQYEEQAGKALLESDLHPTPAAAVERAETVQQARYVLTTLDPRAAKLLVLRYSGLSYAEIAAAIQVSPTSVGTLLARAEKEFAKRYQALERRKA